MPDLIRFGVSFDKDLLDSFDNMIREQKGSNRSEAIRDLVRHKLLETEGVEDSPVAGTITIIYDQQQPLSAKMADIHQDYQEIIQSLQRIFLDQRRCLEVLTVKGYAMTINKLADTIRSLKGVNICSKNTSETRR